MHDFFDHKGPLARGNELTKLPSGYRLDLILDGFAPSLLSRLAKEA